MIPWLGKTAKRSYYLKNKQKQGKCKDLVEHIENDSEDGQCNWRFRGEYLEEKTEK